MRLTDGACGGSPAGPTWVAGLLYALVSIWNSFGESWAFYWLGSAVEAALLLLVIRSAWTWARVESVRAPRTALQPSEAVSG